MISRVGVYGVARRGSEILLVVQEKGPYVGRFDLPGGGIEFGETIEQALHREFLEEVGMDFDSMEPLKNLTALVDIPGGLFHQIGLIYSVTGLRTVKEQRELKYKWVDLQSLQQEDVSPFVWSI